MLLQKTLSSIFLVFPHQLFKPTESLQQAECVILVEEELFFNQYAFHKQKLTYHRASMKFYCSHLQATGIQVEYVEAQASQSNTSALIADLGKKGITEIHCYRVSDNWLEKKIITASTDSHIKLIWHASPMFMIPYDEMKKDFSGVKSFLHNNFYIRQRKRFGILVDEDQNPIGGKWSFDEDNRKPYPKNKIVPQLSQPIINEWRKEAYAYVETHYPNNPGSSNPIIVYPITHQEAEEWLQDFIINRFAEFGLFEDAMIASEHVLHHSVLTPMLNTGLITPQQVIDQVLAAADVHGIPMNSLEGFVRQIIGWREFIHGIYHAVGSKQRTTNYWGFNRKIPASFYNGTTGIVPVDNAIHKLLRTGYNHHIERLMVLSNFMLLCEFDPDEVHRWFMEMYIDAYDWVMVPNIYGMGQFADGGLMCTKPYISGSNYILKMSDYKKDSAWTEIWDGLFWRFMHIHRNFFLKNPRLGMLVRTYDKMPEEKRKYHLKKGEDYLQWLSQEEVAGHL